MSEGVRGLPQGTPGRAATSAIVGVQEAVAIYPRA